MEFNSVSLEEIKNIISSYFKSKEYFTNYYLQNLGSLDYYEDENGLLLRRRDHDIFRIYFYCREGYSLIPLIKDLPERSVINIPTKSEVCEFENELEEVGFKLISKYERWNNPETQIVTSFDGTYAQESDCGEIFEMLNLNFDYRVDHLPDQDELNEMIKQKRVLINVTNSKITGFFIFALQKSKCYFNFWFDGTNRGMELIRNVFYIMNINNIRYSYLWIDSLNTRVKKIHKLLGAKPENFYDYSYYKE